ncbi:MAG: zinc-ribbon domain-containing protein [Catenulispora sp.]|nr:zinc-ribbon domain-containing protein [Catenulispora sp.]
MIVWGWRTVFRVVGSGVFSCPSCGADRNYERRRAQRFFTLFFIPLIPLKTLGEFIRCTACKNDFRESVLARPTAAQFTDLLQNTVRGVMVNVLRRGGAGHPAALAVAVEEIVSSGAIGYSQADLAQDLRVVPEDLTQLLAGLAGQLPESGREALVRGAIRVAAADGPVDVQERAVIDGVGAALGMTQAHVAGVVASVPGAEQQAADPRRTASYHPLTGSPTGPQPAQPGFDPNETRFDPSSSMQTLVIPPRPAPAQPPVPHATLLHESSAMETMMLPPKPAAAVPVPEPENEAANGSGSGYQDHTTIAVAAPVEPVPAPAPPVATPVAPMPDPLTDSSAIQTMVVPLGQVPPQRPQDRGDEPTHVTERPRPEPGAWPPPQQ